MPASLRKCVDERVGLANSLLHQTFGCVDILHSRMSVGQRALVGRAANPLLPAILNLREIGVWIQVGEVWSYNGQLEKIVRHDYRYAVYDEEPEPEGDPDANELYRFEYHRFRDGRMRTLHGYSGFDHVHTNSGFGVDAHVPTYRVTLEGVLSFLAAETPSLTNSEAALAIQRTRETTSKLREWTSIPDTAALVLAESN